MRVDSHYIWVVRSQVSYFLIFAYLCFLVFLQGMPFTSYEEINYKSLGLSVKPLKCSLLTRPSCPLDVVLAPPVITFLHSLLHTVYSSDTNCLELAAYVPFLAFVHLLTQVLLPGLFQYHLLREVSPEPPHLLRARASPWSWAAGLP